MHECVALRQVGEIQKMSTFFCFDDHTQANTKECED